MTTVLDKRARLDFSVQEGPQAAVAAANARRRGARSNQSGRHEKHRYHFIDDGWLRFLDWEFAGMGDIFYDLATLAYTFDSVGEIPSDLQGFILECYFGKTNDYLWNRMVETKFMILLYSVMWGLLQSGLEQAGIIPSVDGFNYFDYASFMFTTIRESNYL